MKILVFSDSHGDRKVLLRAVSDESPDWILHLGDHASDCADVRRAYPQIPLRALRGNCDRTDGEPETDEFVVEGKRIFMTHGHLYGVKYRMGDLINNAMLRGADVLLFGHTHRQVLDERDGLTILNPGSIGRGGARTYAVLTVTPDSLRAELKTLADR